MKVWLSLFFYCARYFVFRRLFSLFLLWSLLTSTLDLCILGVWAWGVTEWAEGTGVRALRTAGDSLVMAGVPSRRVDSRVFRISCGSWRLVLPWIR